MRLSIATKVFLGFVAVLICSASVSLYGIVRLQRIGFGARPGDVERVKASARRLLRLHPLRAADALQLGAALAWADGAPEGLIVHTFDRRLAAAAEREGFRVIPSP